MRRCHRAARAGRTLFPFLADLHIPGLGPSGGSDNEHRSTCEHDLGPVYACVRRVQECPTTSILDDIQHRGTCTHDAMGVMRASQHAGDECSLSGARKCSMLDGRSEGKNGGRMHASRTQAYVSLGCSNSPGAHGAREPEGPEDSREWDAPSTAASRTTPHRTCVAVRTTVQSPLHIEDGRLSTWPAHQPVGLRPEA